PLVPILEGTRRDADGDRQQTRTMVPRTFRRQAPGTPQLHLPYPGSDPLQGGRARQGQAAEAVGQGQVRRSGLAQEAKVRPRAILTDEHTGRAKRHKIAPALRRRPSFTDGGERQAMQLWLIPMVYVGASVACGLVLPRLEQAHLSTYT